MNNRYIYHPEQDTIITRISEVSLLPGPNHCFPLKRTSFIFYHHKLVLPSFNPYINRITEYVPLGFGFFCSTFLRNPCMLLNVAVVHLFSLLYCIHFYKYTHIFLSILLLMDMRFFFFLILAIMGNTVIIVPVFVAGMFLLLLGIYLKVEIYMSCSMHNFCFSIVCRWFFKELCRFSFPKIMY